MEYADGCEGKWNMFDVNSWRRMFAPVSRTRGGGELPGVDIMFRLNRAPPESTWLLRSFRTRISR